MLGQHALNMVKRQGVDGAGRQGRSSRPAVYGAIALMVRLGQVRQGSVGSGMVRLFSVWLGQVWLGKVW